MGKVFHIVSNFDFSYLRLSGNESSIVDCEHRGWGVENCGHSEDASVICSSEYNLNNLCIYDTSVASYALFSKHKNKVILRPIASRSAKHWRKNYLP